MSFGPKSTRDIILKHAGDYVPLEKAVHVSSGSSRVVNRNETSSGIHRASNSVTKEHSTRRKKSRTLGQSDNKIRVGCPFYRHDPRAHHKRVSCRGTGFSEMGKLKDHLKDVHHISKSSLQNLNFRHRKFTGLRTIEAKWTLVYSTLFPDVAKDDVPCPYNDIPLPIEEELEPTKPGVDIQALCCILKARLLQTYGERIRRHVPNLLEDLDGIFLDSIKLLEHGLDGITAAGKLEDSPDRASMLLDPVTESNIHAHGHEAGSVVPKIESPDAKNFLLEYPDSYGSCEMKSDTCNVGTASPPSTYNLPNAEDERLSDFDHVNVSNSHALLSASMNELDMTTVHQCSDEFSWEGYGADDEPFDFNPNRNQQSYVPPAPSFTDDFELLDFINPDAYREQSPASALHQSIATTATQSSINDVEDDFGLNSFYRSPSFSWLNASQESDPGICEENAVEVMNYDAVMRAAHFN